MLFRSEINSIEKTAQISEECKKFTEDKTILENSEFIKEKAVQISEECKKFTEDKTVFENETSIISSSKDSEHLETEGMTEAMNLKESEGFTEVISQNESEGFTEVIKKENESNITKQDIASDRNEANIKMAQKSQGATIEQRLVRKTADGNMQFQRYKVIKKIGEGGMGVVYKAYDIELDRTVAMKVIGGSATETSPIVMRFMQEVKATARLRHPNIVGI